MSNQNDFIIENGVLKQYVGPGGDVVVPDGVTSIGDMAFCGCETLTHITLPEGVSSIGDSAFRRCWRLKNVVFPEHLTYLGKEAFFECGSLESVLIPEGVENIGEKTFFWCSGLQEVCLPKSLLTIGRRAFEDCGSISEITLPPNVEKIMMYAFSGCSNLRKLHTEGEIKAIGTDVFEWTKIPEHGFLCFPARVFSAKTDACIYFITHIKKFSRKSPVYRQNLKTVGSCLLQKDKKGRSIASVVLDCPSVFYALIEGKYIPAKMIDPLLDSLKGSEKIEITAALLQYKNETVKLSRKQRKADAGSDPFRLSEEISTEDLKKVFTYKHENGLLIITGTNNTDGDIVFPSMIGKHPVFALGKGAVSAVSPKKQITVSLSEGIRALREQAINQASNLKIILPRSLAAVAPGAFQSIERVTICFNGRTDLIPNDMIVNSKNESIVIEAPSDSMAEEYAKKNGMCFRAAGASENLNSRDEMSTESQGAELSVPAASLHWTFVKDSKNGGYKITGYIGNESVPVMPKKIGDLAVTAISDRAFYGKNIRGMLLPKTLKHIGHFAFTDCIFLEEIVFPPDIKELPSLFLNCKNLRRVVLPEKLYSLNRNTIPPQFLDGFYYQCENSNLEEIVIDKTNPLFMTDQGVLLDKTKRIILHVPSKIESFEIPEWIVRIDSGVFATTSIRKVKLHGNLTSIRDCAFCCCKELTSICIPSGETTEIGSRAFSGCSQLAEIHIPSNIKKIAENAFLHCNELTIYAPSGSYAEKFAEKNCIPFIREN